MYIIIRPYTWVGLFAKMGCAPSAKRRPPAVTALSMCTWSALEPELLCIPSRPIVAPIASAACQGPNFCLSAIAAIPG